jgi:hypothetical protein
MLNSLTKNPDALKWFKQMMFLIHRNTYGGLGKHEMEALHEIKINFGILLDEPEKEYLTSLIDSLSLYELPTIMNGQTTNKLLEKDIFKYISGQRTEDMCDILIEYLPKNNGLLLSIEKNESALALVDELVLFAENNPPDRMAELGMTPCNVWDMIKNARKLPENHINIVFITHDDEEANVMFFKGLCTAQAYLKESAVAPVEIKPREREKKAFMPNFSYGIATLARKITGGELSSDVMLSRDVSADDEKPARAKGIKGLFKGITKPKTKAVVIAKEYDMAGEVSAEAEDTEQAVEYVNAEEYEEYIPDESTSFKGQGHFDIEQGYLFNIT